MAAAKNVAGAAGIGGAGLMAGFALSPETGLAILKWLGESVGPVGLIAVLTLGVGIGISVTGNWLMWIRLKEKDQECQAELGRQRASWKSVVDGKDDDNKEIAKTVADLLVQVTKLTERMNPSRTRSP